MSESRNGFSPRIAYVVVLGVMGCVVLALSFAARASAAGVVVQNGKVTLGVNPLGNLIATGPTSEDPSVGLTFDRADALEPGCHCEGWGAGDALTGAAGYAGDVEGVRGLRLMRFSYDPASRLATSVTKIRSAGLRVTQRYSPKTHNFIINKVTVKNYGTATVDARYRRTMDWDVAPTEFDELVTIDAGNASGIIHTSDDGFANPSPFAADDPLLFNGNAEDSGPEDHGALFDFDLGALAPGQSTSIKLYWGGAPDESTAKSLLGRIDAEAYSLGEPASGGTTGEPNTFIFAATGVGGDPLCDESSGTCDPISGTGPYSPGRALAPHSLRRADLNQGVKP